MKILDTDILVAILRGKKDVKNLLDYLNHQEIAITSITAFELYYGAFKSERVLENVGEVDRLLSYYPLINFDNNASKYAGKIYSKLEMSGMNIGLRDVLIGAICMANNASIITRNVKHYSRIDGLNIEKL